MPPEDTYPRSHVKLVESNTVVIGVGLLAFASVGGTDALQYNGISAENKENC